MLIKHQRFARVLFFGVMTFIAACATAPLQQSTPGDQPRGAQQLARTIAPNERARFEYYQQLLRDPATGRIPPNIRAAELAYVRAELSLKPNRAPGNPWREAGPDDIGGRTRAILVDVRDSQTVLVGGVAGGVWKSTDGGDNWTLTTRDDQPLSVTSIAQDVRPGFEDTLYYTSGEYIGTSYSLSFWYGGTGVYKSIDSGDSWSLLASTSDADPTTFDLPFDVAQRVAVSHVTGTVFVASNGFGVYRSADGGATWSQAIGAPFGHEYSDVAVASNGAIVAVLSQSNAGIPSPVAAGVYVSADDGMSWLNRTPAVFPATHRRSVLALAPSNPNLAYVFVDDFGTYRLIKLNLASAIGVNVTANLPAYPGLSIYTQAGYNMAIAVKPDDENVVLFGASSLVRTFDGFATREPVRERGWIGGYYWAGGNYPGHHVDSHAIVFDPNNPRRVWSGHDGGVSLTLDCLAAPVEWLDRNLGYNVTQFNGVAIPAVAGDDRIMGGTQDNGTPYTRWDSPPLNSQDVSGGDGGYSFFQPTYAYLGTQGGNLTRMEYAVDGAPRLNPVNAKPTGAVGLWVHPFAVDPNDEDILYYPDEGGFMWRNTSMTTAPSAYARLSNVGPGTNPISALAVSTIPPNVLYFAVSDEITGFPLPTPGLDRPRLFRLDNAHIAIDGEVDVGDPSWPAGAWIQDIAIHPDNADELLVVMTNYNIAGTWHSTNGGATWTDVEGNLTGVNSTTQAGPSIRTAVIVPVAGGGTEYILGTSIGLFSTQVLAGAATRWQEEGRQVTGQAIVTQVRARVADDVVAASTHGRGLFVRAPGLGATVYEWDTPQDVLLHPVGTASTSPFDYAPGTADTLYYQVDDGSGFPGEIYMTKGGLGVLIHW